MLDISFVATVILVTISGASLYLIALLLSGAPTVVSRSDVRASARSDSGASASGSGRRGPRPGARPARPGR